MEYNDRRDFYKRNTPIIGLLLIGEKKKEFLMGIIHNVLTRMPRSA